MSQFAHSRTPFLVWALVACPILAWIVAVYGAHGEGGAAKFLFLFLALPALLTIGGGKVMGRRWTESAFVALLSALCGGLTWILTIAYLASQGVFD
jgi:hypothetical protein